MKITKTVLTEIETGISDMLAVNQADLDYAFLAAGDDPLNISMKAGLIMDEGKVKVVTTINCVKERIKDERKGWVDEEQINLFDEEGGEE